MSPASVPAGRSDSAASRNRPAVNSAGSRKSPASVPAGRSDSAASRNRPAVNSAGSRKSPASVPAGRSDSAASRNRPAVNSAGSRISLDQQLFLLVDQFLLVGSILLLDHISDHHLFIFILRLTYMT
ncbi:hypothetical protein Tco_1388152, partial [Tanacetum coccineum]